MTLFTPQREHRGSLFTAKLTKATEENTPKEAPIKFIIRLVVIDVSYPSILYQY
jgi:hypothetical protein